MGKKRSNKKKKWSLVENVSKNSTGEKSTDPAFNSSLKGENNKAKSKLSHESQNIKTLSYKGSLEKTNKSDISAASPSAGADKSSKTCKPSSVKPSGVNSLSQTHKVKPVTLDPFDKKDTVYDNSIKKYSSIPSKSNSKKKAPELMIKDFNDKSYLTDFLGGDCCESDKGAACDSEEKQYGYSARKYSSIPSKSKNQRKAPELMIKDFNDKSYLTDFLGGDCCESDKGAACDSEEKQYGYSARKYSSIPSKSKNQRKAPELMVKDFNDKSCLTDYSGDDCCESDKGAACDSEEKQYGYSARKYSSIPSKSKNQRKAPELMVKDFNDKSYLTDFLGGDCCESDKGAACDSEEKQYGYSARKYSSIPSKSKNQRKAPELMIKDFNDKSYLTDFLGGDCCESDKGAACDSEEKQYGYSARKYSSIPSKSKNQRKAPELMVKDFNDKSCLTDYSGDDCYESDKGAACDFFKPVFDEYRKSTNSKNKNLRANRRGMNVEESYFDDPIWSLQAGSSTANRFDKDDLEVSESRLELWSSLPSYSPVNSSETGDFDNKMELKENISCRVDAYKNSKETFAEVYRTWLPGRRGTLEKLKALLSEVHGDQLNFNKSQVACKEVGLLARYAKSADSQVVSFLGSFTAFLTDAACGVVSTAQAFNIDSYQSKFKEIMEEDAKITKRLYTERSNCVMEYQNIEEVMRKFHPDSFSTTVSKISDSLEVNKYWKAMKEAYGKDDMPQLLNIVSKFLDNAFQPTKLEEVKDSVFSYVNDNPKALEACKSATQATYGYLDTWTLNQSRLPVLKGVSTAANLYLIQEDRSEIERLNNAISEDLPQSKLESQIEDAIDSLELEMKDINRTYYELFKIYVDSNGSEWEISEMY